ncbi:hypothetical protein Nepgr_009698 [Nepenthes gracilis]|uniref:non-specific serine/threonine protein kinase n=1 Tax=Nepenthes gracilis TaxID=150966 RepID=A0AAD3XKD8_NEPGR|nr:hypothetical protein Nepgr_009698 [Nepenthes gracilis]
MGNNCVGPSISKNGFLQTVSAAIWRSRSTNNAASCPNRETNHEEPPHPSLITTKEPGLPLPTQNEPPKQMTIPKAEAQPVDQPKPKRPIQFKRIPSAGLRIDSVLQRRTGNVKEFYSLGRKLGQGQFGTTFLCIEKATGNKYACKSIAKRKLLTDDDVEDVRREIQIMHHLAGHPNVISLKAAYEDAVAVHLVMELCKGGELLIGSFSMGIIQRDRQLSLLGP